MHRRTCLLTGTLLAFAWPASHAADDVEGRWLAEVGPPDNRALVGLELERGADGTLRARYTIDLLNFYGAALPPLQPDAAGGWQLARYGLAVTRQGDVLRVTGLLDDPLDDPLDCAASTACLGRPSAPCPRRVRPRSGNCGWVGRSSRPPRRTATWPMSATPTV